MARKTVIGLLVFASMAMTGGAALADEPSLHQVYQAAEAGRLGEAQTMMHEVLQAHPNSGKAHFVEAELLAKQGQFQKAEAELATAERLAPGLPFAKPQAVQNLKSLLGAPRDVRSAETQHVQPIQAPHESSFPWGMLFIGLGLAGFIAWAVRFMTQRNPSPMATSALNPASANGYGQGNVSPAYGMPMQSYGAGGVGPMAAQGPGLGSRVMGGLATGAAVGAGVVAGEALMHHFMDGKSENSQRTPLESSLSPQDSYFNDLGGSDFGVADTSSWEDGSSGGSDWN